MENRNLHSYFYKLSKYVSSLSARASEVVVNFFLRIKIEDLNDMNFHLSDNLKTGTSPIYVVG